MIHQQFLKNSIYSRTANYQIQNLDCGKKQISSRCVRLNYYTSPNELIAHDTQRDPKAIAALSLSLSPYLSLTPSIFFVAKAENGLGIPSSKMSLQTLSGSRCAPR